MSMYEVSTLAQPPPTALSPFLYRNWFSVKLARPLRPRWTDMDLSKDSWLQWVGTFTKPQFEKIQCIFVAGVHCRYWQEVKYCRLYGPRYFNATPQLKHKRLFLGGSWLPFPCFFPALSFGRSADPGPMADHVYTIDVKNYPFCVIRRVQARVVLSLAVSGSLWVPLASSGSHWL